MDGPPDDKEGFFGHPLTRAEIAINGEAQQDAQREALLHEYMNLQAWDKQGGRIRDCFAPAVGVPAPSASGSAAAAAVAVVSTTGQDGDGVVSSSVVVSDCSMSVGDESGPAEDKPKVAQVPSSTANDYFILLDQPGSELAKFHHFDRLLQGDPHSACPDVDVAFPEEAVELEVTSGSLGEVKSDGGKKTIVLPKPATRRPTPPTRSVPVRSLRRSESDPCATPAGRMFALGTGGTGLSALPEPSLQHPFSSEALAGDAAQTLMNGGDPEDAVVRVQHGATQTSSSAVCGLDGLDVALAVSVSSSRFPPRGHCLISSSSRPTLRISSSVPNPAPDPADPGSVKQAAARGKGRGSKGGQSRARGGQGSRGKAGSKRRHSLASTPAIITSTSAASSLPSSVSSSVLHGSAAHSPASSLPLTPPSSSPAVPSSALPPAVSVTEVAEGVLTSTVTDPAAAVLPSPSASPASVLLLPLMAVEPDPAASAAAVVVPGHTAHAASSVGAQTQPDSAETVRQTTKDKLKLRIAQTALTQMPERPPPPPPQQQQQQQQTHPQQLMNGKIEQRVEVHPPCYPEPYQLTQQPFQQDHQQQNLLKVQQQQQQQQQPNPASSSPQEHLNFLNEHEFVAADMGDKLADMLPVIKQESQFLDYDPGYPPPYTSEASLQVLYNSVPMATSEAVLGEGHPGLVSMATEGGRECEEGLTEAEIFSQMTTDSLLVQPQFLHLLQPVDMGQPPQHQQHQLQQHAQQTVANGYYNSNDNLYIYTSSADSTGQGGKMEVSLLDMDSEKKALQYAHHQHRQQQQQQQRQQEQRQLQEQYGFGYQPRVGVVNMDTSPDSGIGQDPGLSPTTAVMTLKETTGNDGITRKDGKSLKRRKSSHNPVLQRQCSSGSDKVLPRNPAIQKLEVNTTGYQYYMDAPISTTQRIEEDRVTYLNKSQYYPLVLENTRPERVPKGIMCKSVIMLVFREEKSQEEESKAWQFWHSRQHSYKQRILDIDTKNSQGVGPSSISELAFNAVSVKWNPREGPVRVNIAVHCLSTDFSNQKGVKGIPLHIQCDTYELFDCSRELLPSHRGYCQIKVFCDKGAERKTRDEERRRNAKTSKQPETPGTSPGRKKSEEVFHPPCERSEFYSLADLSTTPVYFSPSYITGDCSTNESTTAIRTEASSSQQSPSQSEVSDENTPSKVPRLSSCASCNKFLTPLLYVKESHDKAYHAIHLQLPTVEELLKAISYKFNKQLRNVTNFFKRSKNGILVRMDDDIIRRYSHETAFLLEIHNEGREDMEVILLENCTEAPSPSVPHSSPPGPGTLTTGGGW